MAKQGNWNKSFWKQLDTIWQWPITDIRQIMLEELGKTEAIMMERTPVRYGGLKSSIYSAVHDTPNGISAVIGYTQTPHWDLEPNNPHQDEITNPQLAEILLNKPNKPPKYIPGQGLVVQSTSQHDMQDIMLELDDCRYNIRDRIDGLLRTYFKRR